MLLLALRPTLQILNLENFQITMYSVIRANNYLSSMYWLAWIILGKFIFLTLFLAVTLDAFERKYEVRRGALTVRLNCAQSCEAATAGQLYRTGTVG